MVNRIELIKKFMDKIIAYYPELYIDFNYDHYKAKKLKDRTRKYTINNTKIDNIEVNF